MVCTWCKTDEFIQVSRGPGRRLGPIARNFGNIELVLPVDFEYPYCAKCDLRILTPAVKAAFIAIEEQLEASMRSKDFRPNIGTRAREILAKIEDKKRRSEEEVWRDQHQRDIDATEAIVEDLVLSEAEKGHNRLDIMGVGDRCYELGRQPNPGVPVLTCDQCLGLEERLKAQDLGVELKLDDKLRNAVLYVTW